MEVDEIPDTSKNAKGEGARDEQAANKSRGSSWRDKCGDTKLHIFHQTVYNKILYIESDCLVQKDVSHLFKSHSDFPRDRLLAAALKIFLPD